MQHLLSTLLALLACSRVPLMMGNVEVIFLGTGASIESPAIQCLLREDGCLGCKTALSTAPKNKRRQSSILVRIKQDDDSLKNILVDCGGTTYAAMMEIFPKHGVDRIDAVLFTHSHADAIGGCDALRYFCTQSILQESIEFYSTIDVKDKMLNRLYIWMKDDTKHWNFNTFDAAGDTLHLFGCTIKTTPVIHGKHYFDGSPYHSQAFCFDKKLLYISDVSEITADMLQRLQEATGSEGPSVFIVDSLNFGPSSTHFSLAQGIACARRLNAKRTFLTQMRHGVSHEALEACGNAFRAGQVAKQAYVPRNGRRALSEYTQKEHLPLWQRRTKDGKVIDRTHITQMSLPKALGIADDDFEGIVEIALSETESYEGKPNKPIDVSPAYDGLVLRIE